MFGYVQPFEPELKVRDLQLFKAYYCGLCRTLGKTVSPPARLCLNNDMVFLYLLLSSVETEPETITFGRCMLHPTIQRPFADINEPAAYSAVINTMLAWMKLDDDWRDDHSLKAFFAKPLFYLPAKKTRKLSPDLWEDLKTRLRLLSQLEKSNCASIDEASNPFAQILGQICAAPYIPDTNDRQALYWIGYNMGRWIYLLDAFDDLGQDVKKSSYNPIFLQFNALYKGDLADFITEIRPIMEDRLMFTLDSTAKSYELLGVIKNKEILDNIIYLGMRKRTEEVLNRRLER